MTYILLCIQIFVYVNVLTISNVQAMYLLVIFLIYDSRYRYLGKNMFLNLYVESNILDISYVRTILVLLIIIFILSISWCKVCTYVLILVVKIIHLWTNLRTYAFDIYCLWHCFWVCSSTYVVTLVVPWLCLGGVELLHCISS